MIINNQFDNDEDVQMFLRTILQQIDSLLQCSSPSVIESITTNILEYPSMIRSRLVDTYRPANKITILSIIDQIINNMNRSNFNAKIKQEVKDVLQDVMFDVRKISKAWKMFYQWHLVIEADYLQGLGDRLAGDPELGQLVEKDKKEIYQIFVNAGIDLKYIARLNYRSNQVVQQQQQQQQQQTNYNLYQNIKVMNEHGQWVHQQDHGWNNNQSHQQSQSQQQQQSQSQQQQQPQQQQQLQQQPQQQLQQQPQQQQYINNDNKAINHQTNNWLSSDYSGYNENGKQNNIETDRSLKSLQSNQNMKQNMDQGNRNQKEVKDKRRVNEEYDQQTQNKKVKTQMIESKDIIHNNQDMEMLTRCLDAFDQHMAQQQSNNISSDQSNQQQHYQQQQNYQQAQKCPQLQDLYQYQYQQTQINRYQQSQNTKYEQIYQNNNQQQNKDKDKEQNGNKNMKSRVELNEYQMELLRKMDEFDRNLLIQEQSFEPEILRMEVSQSTFEQIENLNLSTQIQLINQKVDDLYNYCDVSYHYKEQEIDQKRYNRLLSLIKQLKIYSYLNSKIVGYNQRVELDQTNIKKYKIYRHFDLAVKMSGIMELVDSGGENGQQQVKKEQEVVSQGFIRF